MAKPLRSVPYGEQRGGRAGCLARPKPPAGDAVTGLQHCAAGSPCPVSPQPAAAMPNAADVTIAAVALLHLCFLVLETFLCPRRAGRRAFGLSAEFAAQTNTLAAISGCTTAFSPPVCSGGSASTPWLRRESVFPRLRTARRPVWRAHGEPENPADTGVAGGARTGTDAVGLNMLPGVSETRAACTRQSIPRAGRRTTRGIPCSSGLADALRYAVGSPKLRSGCRRLPCPRFPSHPKILSRPRAGMAVTRGRRCRRRRS